MKTVSSAFLNAVTAPHTFIRRVDVWSGGSPVLADIAVVDGSVTLDRTAQIMGRCTVTVADLSLIPALAADLLTPFGNELRIWRGVRLGGGDELVSLGIFKITDIKVDDPAKTVEITGRDRSQTVLDANFEAPYVIPAGTNYAVAIQQMIDAGVPGLTYGFTSTEHTTPLLVFIDGENGARWKQAQSMATSIGCELYFNGNGECILRDEPRLTTIPNVTVTDGENGVLISAAKTWSRDTAYNAIVVTSSAPDVAPVHEVVYNTNPASPTYYYGKFGRKPRRYASPFVTTALQAQSAGDSILRRESGVTQVVDFAISPNPAIEPGDVVHIRRPSVGLDGLGVVDSVHIGLTAGSEMTANVRTYADVATATVVPTTPVPTPTPIDTSQLLTWSPPAGYTTFTSYLIAANGSGSLGVTIDGITTHTLDDSTDYRISAPSTITNAISIKGGRNVVWIGGHIKIDNKGVFPIADARRALLIADGAAAVTGRIVHIEGLLADGNDLADAINLDCPAAIVQIQNYRADGCHFRSCDDRDSTQDYTGNGTHPDVIQPWGGCYEWRTDKVTGVSAYQGFFLNSLLLAEAPARTFIRRYNWRATSHISNEEAPYSSGGSYAAGQSLATFDATIESWSSGNSGSTITQTVTSPQSGAGSLNISRPFATTFDQVWVRSPTGQVITNNLLGAWVKIPTGSLGTWTARVGFNLAAGTTITPTATSVAADSAWHFVSCDVTALGHVPADVDRVLVQIQRGSGQALTTINVGVDTVTSGSVPAPGFTGPSETYYGIRALSLGTNWNDVYIDSAPAAGVYVEHSANSGWATPSNSSATRQISTGSGFFWTRRYDPAHASADVNGYVIDPVPGNSAFHNAFFPDPGTVTTTSADWTTEARFHNWDGTGNARAYAGPPPGGDWVLASSVGIGYVSPGYVS